MTEITLTLPRAELDRALSQLARVVERRNTIPILSNIRLALADGVLTMTASDLDIEARTELPAPNAAGADETTMPAARLAEIVRKIDDDQVRLSWVPGGHGATLTGGRARFQLQTLPATDFPNLDAGDMTHEFTLPAKALARLVDDTSFAMSTEETRYYLNGIYLHVAAGEDGLVLRAVATDGHRLSRSDTPAPQGAAGMLGVIVPRKSVGEIARLARDAEGDARVALSATKIAVTIGATRYLSKLIDGAFPDYARGIPTNNDKSATLDREAFAAAAARVATISSERGRAVKLEFTDSRLRLSVKSPDAGEAADEIDADYESGSLEIGFNASYLADVLTHLGGENVCIDLADAGSPTIFRPAVASARLVVLMPMRV